MQSLNILSIVSALVVSKLDKSKYFNLLQELNINENSLTCMVKKFSRFNDSKFEQPENIQAIDLINFVSNFDTSNDVSELHPWNMEVKSET